MEDLAAMETVYFSLGVFVLSYLLRKLLERLFPAIRSDTPLTKAQRVWEEVILPSMPVLVGVLMALTIRKYPYPTLVGGIGSRIIFGSITGFFCGWAYRIIKAFVAKKFEIEVPDPLVLSDRPPP